MSRPCSSQQLPVAWRDGGCEAWGGWHEHEGSPRSPFSARTAAGIAWETASSEEDSCEGQPYETEVDHLSASARRSLDASMDSLHDSCHGETRVGELLKRDREALPQAEPAGACSCDSSLASLSARTTSLGACCSSVEGLADSLCDFQMAVSSARPDSPSNSSSIESPAKRLRLRPIALPESEALPTGQHPPPPPPTPLGTPGRLERRCHRADWGAEDEGERAGGEGVRHLSQETEALGLVLTRPHQRPLGPLPLTLKRRKVSTMSGVLSPSSHSWASLSVSGTLLGGLCGDAL